MEDQSHFIQQIDIPLEHIGHHGSQRKCGGHAVHRSHAAALFGVRLHMRVKLVECELLQSEVRGDDPAEKVIVGVPS